MTPRPALAGFLTVLLTIGCNGGRDHEALGDRAYAEQQYGPALSEYRLAISEDPSPQLHSKAGQAALRAEQLLIAADEFMALGADEDHALQAADGLERVARRAVATGNPTALQAAIVGLQGVAANRAVGGFAREMAESLGENPRSQEALEILPNAAAAASAVGQMDSLMHVYGKALRALGRCEEATPVFESLVRRDRLPNIPELREDGAFCALRVAQTRLQRGLAAESRPWFRRAIELNGPESNQRTAWLGLGDAHAEMQDLEGAVDAYERAREGLFFTDPLYDVVQSRLNSIFNPGTRIR